MKITLRLLIAALSISAASANPAMSKRQLPLPDGIPRGVCAGSQQEGGNDSGKLSCPLQPGAVDILCSGGGSNGGAECFPRGTCSVFDKSKCRDGESKDNGCTCLTGNFCCSDKTEVPGGQHAVDYFKDVGCHCNG